MAEKIKSHPFIEENISISSKNKKEKKGNDKKIPIIRKENNNIVIELPQKNIDDEENSTNSAEYSGQNLKKEMIIENKSGNKKPIVLSQKAYDKYTERLKDRTMRKEIEKMDKETERLRKKFDEQNSFLHLFDNNPQYRKVIKFVQKQLIFIFILGAIMSAFSGISYFYVTQGKEGIPLIGFLLSIVGLSMFLILIISLKFGLLNDPNLSKAFRLFVILEFSLLFSSFILNIIIPFLLKKNLKKYISDIKIRIFIYILFLLMILFFFITVKYCYSLFIESILILINKKTEYSILMINEKNSFSEGNIIANLSTSNNISSDALNKSTSTGIINENLNKYNNPASMNKEEEQFRNYNFFNQFHYSVTSNRKEDKYLNYNEYKKKI